MKKDKKNFRENEQGFMLIVLILGLLILSLLYLYSIRSVQTQVQKSSEETINTIDPTIQNPQKTVDGVRDRVNEEVKNEQKKLDDIEKQLSE
jgi:competence protein ComGC